MPSHKQPPRARSKKAFDGPEAKQAVSSPAPPHIETAGSAGSTCKAVLVPMTTGPLSAPRSLRFHASILHTRQKRWGSPLTFFVRQRHVGCWRDHCSCDPTAKFSQSSGRWANPSGHVVTRWGVSRCTEVAAHVLARGSVRMPRAVGSRPEIRPLSGHVADSPGVPMSQLYRLLLLRLFRRQTPCQTRNKVVAPRLVVTPLLYKPAPLNHLFSPPTTSLSSTRPLY